MRDLAALTAVGRVGGAGTGGAIAVRTAGRLRAKGGHGLQLSGQAASSMPVRPDGGLAWDRATFACAGSPAAIFSRKSAG